MDRQRGILRDALGDGAYGLSTGLDYPPSAYATTDELVALTETARFGGIYHTHVRYPLGDRYLDPFREAIEIGRRAGMPAHLTHFYHRETIPAGTSPCSASSTMRAPRASTSRTTPTPTSGRAPGS